jgi:rhodanese-related sulfurtransferase
MYEHPADVVQQKVVASPLDMAVDQPHVLRLPHFESEQVGDLPRITGATMIDVLDGKFSHLHDKVLVVDCRFEYEYDGGHINGAVNFNDKEKLAEHLFNISSPTTTSRSLIIFHCEYSAHRAPIMAKFLRSHDRTVNGERYPALTYPEAYILDGGYSSFFKHYRSRCFPQEYVEMDSQEHASACEKGLGKVKQQRPGKIRRSNTFAMGQGSSPMGSSPMGARALQRHVSESMWSPKAIGRARSRNTSESTVEAMTLSPGDTRMSDADSEIDFIVDIPSFKPITAGRLSLFGTGAQGRPSLFGPGGGAQTRRWESSHT